MSNQAIESAVKSFVDRLRKELEERINYVREFEKEVERKMKEFEEYLKEVAKITLPLNLLEIMGKGGFVKVWEVNEDSEFVLSVSKNYHRMDMSPYGNFDEVKFPPGKYRIILIVEKLQ